MPSVFPGAIDTFTTHYDPPPSMLNTIARFEELRSKPNKSGTELEEYNNLAAALAPYIFTTEELNTMQDAMVKIEEYFLSDIQAMVEKYVYAFSFVGEYSDDVEYIEDNVVYKNFNLYKLIVPTSQGVAPPNNNYWALMLPGLKGDKGDPGSDLIFMGAWAPNYSTYHVNDLVSYGHKLYACKQEHVSGTTFDGIYWECVTEAANLDMASLAHLLGYAYRCEISEAEGSSTVTEKIVSSFDPGDPFNTGQYGSTILLCTTTISETNTQDIIEAVYTDTMHFFGNSDTFTIRTIVNGDSVVTFDL